MHRFLIFLLSLAAFAVPTTSWEASTSGHLAINITPGQAITAVGLSNTTFTGGAPSGTVVGALSVTMSPASPAFSGSLSLSGTNASQFQISGGNLTTNGVVPAGTYQVNIVATEAGVTGSPFAQAETITASSASPADPETPGPSGALYANPPYACTANRYVATTGSDSNNGTSPSTPWATLGHATSQALASGTCVNIATGTYSISGVTLSHGGTTSSPTGYVVYRCQALSGCVFRENTSNVNSFFDIQPTGNYLIFDALELDGNNNNVYGACITSSRPGGGPAHHLWIINSVIHGCGLSGVQFNNSEWYWILHNKVYNNSSSDTSGSFGSGISVYEPEILSGYTPSTMDNQWSPYTVVMAYNVAHDNFNCQTCGSGNTDGNGIIFDDWLHTQNTPNTPFAHQGLAFGNITYHNGGWGINVFSSVNAVVVNNTSYNNFWDSVNSATYRGEFEQNDSGSITFRNNIGWANTATNSQNVPFLGRNATGLNNWSNNIAFGADVNFGEGDAFPTPVNKTNTDPLLMNAPNNNFSLQGGSPSIGFGDGGNYGPYTTPITIDAGACYHTLSACP